MLSNQAEICLECRKKSLPFSVTAVSTETWDTLSCLVQANDVGKSLSFLCPSVFLLISTLKNKVARIENDQKLNIRNSLQYFHCFDNIHVQATKYTLHNINGIIKWSYSFI